MAPRATALCMHAQFEVPGNLVVILRPYTRVAYWGQWRASAVALYLVCPSQHPADRRLVPGRGTNMEVVARASKNSVEEGLPSLALSRIGASGPYPRASALVPHLAARRPTGRGTADSDPRLRRDSPTPGFAKQFRWRWSRTARDDDASVHPTADSSTTLGEFPGSSMPQRG